MKEILIQIKLNKKLTRMRRKNVNNGFIYKTDNAACISIILNKNIELSILFKLWFLRICINDIFPDTNLLLIIKLF